MTLNLLPNQLKDFEAIKKFAKNVCEEHLGANWIKNGDKFKLSEFKGFV